RVASEEEVNISESVIAATDQIILSCGTFMEFSEPNVFASTGSVSLIFNNPNALISEIIIKWDPEISYKNTHPDLGYKNKLYLGSIIGSASFLLEEKSRLEFIGFKTLTIAFNMRILERLRQEGRL
ncbi:MAG: hypothetical protein Q8Q56_03875, partial [Alphaproteobacteria bacterium]|nr:hypothetical protein [Alphaproteobacteria bacterium]